MAQAQKQSLTSFTARHSIFKEIIDILWEMQKAGQSLSSFSTLCGLSHGTLHTWVSGHVLTPRIDTLAKVAEQLGYEIVLEKNKRRPTLKPVK